MGAIWCQTDIDSSELRPLEAPSPKEKAVAAPTMSLNVGQPKEIAGTAIDEVVLDESRGLANLPL